jgi:hypothetical protein
MLKSWRATSEPQSSLGALTEFVTAGRHTLAGMAQSFELWSGAGAAADPGIAGAWHPGPWHGSGKSPDGSGV